MKKKKKDVSFSFAKIPWGKDCPEKVASPLDLFSWVFLDVKTSADGYTFQLHQMLVRF